MTDDSRTQNAPRRRWTVSAAVVAAVAAIGLALLAPQASAQGWWPFGGDDDPPPVPREPVRRPDVQPVPAPIPPGAPGASTWSTKNPICLQLEQRLVLEGQKGSQGQARLPQIESEIRTADRTYNIASQQLDKGCYEYFLFTKTFRNTPKCKSLARQAEDSRRQLAELEAQRQEIIGSSERSYRDDIIRELARNNCGANYVDEARRRDSGFWRDEEAIGSNNWTPFGSTGVATYRTLCVRLCDGYYFPISFSTLPSHFAQDAQVCSSRCAAPAELYYYPNPGGTPDQSVALKTQEAYTQLKEAFRYRKEYVKGCSCKAAEYVPDSARTTNQKAAAPSPAPSQRTAEGAAGGAPGLTTGSTGAAAPAPAAAPGAAASPEAAAPAEAVPAPAPGSTSDGGVSGWQIEVQ